jgi:hypothetical protein
MTKPAALVQADLTSARHMDVRLEQSLAALGRQFKLHKRTVHAHLVRAGVDLRPQQVLTPEQVVEVIELYKGGATLKQLGPQFGVANASIRNYLLRARVELRAAKPQRCQAASD